MVAGLDKNMTKEQIAYSAHDKRKLGNMGINLTNENVIHNDNAKVKFNFL